MAVYELGRSEKHAGYLGVSGEDERRLNWSDPIMGDPLVPLSAWNPPRLTQYLGQGKKKRKPKPLGDAPSSGELLLISQRAADALADIWQRHALLYPVMLDDADQPYYMVVVQTVVDEALDRKKSSGKLNTYGGNPKHFVTLDEWVFDEKKLKGVEIFRIPDLKLAYYVTDAFKQRVIDAKLKGFCLKTRFWDDKPFIS
jgi:hypothetical protein